MENNSKTHQILIFVIVVLLALLVVGSILFFSKPSSETSQPQGEPSATTSTSASSPAAPMTCQQTVDADAAAAGYTIATSSILVSFTASTTLTQAEAVLAAVNASTTGVDPDAFAENHIIQADVLPDSRNTTICTLRGNSSVHYAGFDQLFFLHQ